MKAPVHQQFSVPFKLFTTGTFYATLYVSGVPEKEAVVSGELCAGEGDAPFEPQELEDAHQRDVPPELLKKEEASG